jgi:methionine-rich copper-binding protein CopC
MQLPRRSRAAVLIAAAGLLAVGITALARPPVAAARLSAATPADGASLAAAPAAVSLTFSTAVGEAHLQVSGAQTGQPPVIDGRTVTQPVTAARAGGHVVSYHVLTSGGREVSGTLSFTTARPGGPAAALPPAADPAADLAATGHQHDAPDPLTAALLGVNALVLLVLGVRFVRTGRRRAHR